MILNINMHLLEAYALNCGLKIDKPTITEEEMDGIPDKFIIFNPHSKGENRFFEKWQETINLIYPELEKRNTSIIQIDSLEKEYDKCKKISNLTWNQTAFLVKKCSLLLGIDSFCMHLASLYDKKMVILYAGNVNFNSTRPYFGDYSNYRFLIPFLKDKKPTYSFNTGKEYINQHNPEKIKEYFMELIDK